MYIFGRDKNACSHSNAKAKGCYVTDKLQFEFKAEKTCQSYDKNLSKFGDQIIIIQRYFVPHYAKPSNFTSSLNKLHGWKDVKFGCKQIHENQIHHTALQVQG